ncbi:HepT-like ribonuclease domain-containing protein [Brevundimonas sp. CEF1]|uniref:HepT-like ribonuclease domain-containing protein n=1 Tax=Brevundimonas sp. CEF1 TaxID=3442642 RepID=UPI000FA1BB20
MSERDRLHLQEMIGAIDELAVQTTGGEQETWIEDRTRVAAASMYLIVLGEGAQNLSAEMKALAPDVPWANIAGLRHRLAHSYFRADRRLIWQAASGHAQALKSVLERLLRSLGPETF